MSNSKGKAIMEKYVELAAQDKPMCLAAQEATIKRWLNVFDDLLSQSGFSGYDENCIVLAIVLLLISCPDITTEYVRKEVRKIYNKHGILSPESDIMKFFLGRKKLTK